MLDFRKIDPDIHAQGAKFKLVDRIMVSPLLIKGLVDALRETIEKF